MTLVPIVRVDVNAGLCEITKTTRCFQHKKIQFELARIAYRAHDLITRETIRMH